MKLFHVSPSKLSIFCASSAVPSVQVTSACVSPRVNTAEPWVRGSTPVSIRDRPHLVELAAVEADAVREHLFAQDLLLQLLEDGLGLDLPLDFAFGNRRDQILERLVDGLVVFELAADAHRLGERHVDLLFDLAVEVVADFLLRDRHLLLARLFGEIVDAGDDLLDRRVRRLERLDDLLLGHFLRAGLDHHQAVLAAGDDQIELALFALLERRVDEVLAVDQADADAGDRLLERNLGERERGGRAGDREHVGVVLLIGREDQRDDLRLEAPAGGEQRPRRAVDARGSSALPFRPACLRA